MRAKMDYVTGTYFIRGRNNYLCPFCKQQINSGTIQFVRVQENGDILTRCDGETYRMKTFTRFHINCAEKLTDLTDKEKNLLQNKPKPDVIAGTIWSTEIKSEKHLENVFLQTLTRLEKQKKLFYLHIPHGLVKYPNIEHPFRIGRNGVSDIIVFFPKNRTVFTELKWEEGKLNPNQKEFQEHITNLGYEYSCVRNKPDIENLLKDCLQ
jgi:hypothetical protein